MLQVYEVQFDCLKHVVEWQRDQLIQTIDWGCILKEENENLICYWLIEKKFKKTEFTNQFVTAIQDVWYHIRGQHNLQPFPIKN